MSCPILKLASPASVLTDSLEWVTALQNKTQPAFLTIFEVRCKLHFCSQALFKIEIHSWWELFIYLKMILLWIDSRAWVQIGKANISAAHRFEYHCSSEVLGFSVARTVLFTASVSHCLLLFPVHLLSFAQKPSQKKSGAGYRVVPFCSSLRCSWSNAIPFLRTAEQQHRQPWKKKK